MLTIKSSSIAATQALFRLASANCIIENALPREFDSVADPDTKLCMPQADCN